MVPSLGSMAIHSLSWKVTSLGATAAMTTCPSEARQVLPPSLLLATQMALSFFVRAPSTRLKAIPATNTSPSGLKALTASPVPWKPTTGDLRDSGRGWRVSRGLQAGEMGIVGAGLALAAWLGLRRRRPVAALGVL